MLASNYEKSYFIVESGTAAITCEGRHVRHVKAYDTFGELSALHRQPHTATVVATSNFVVWEANQLAFDEFTAENPTVRSAFEHRQRIRDALSNVHWFLPIIQDEMKVRPLFDGSAALLNFF